MSNENRRHKLRTFASSTQGLQKWTTTERNRVFKPVQSATERLKNLNAAVLAMFQSDKLPEGLLTEEELQQIVSQQQHQEPHTHRRTNR